MVELEVLANRRLMGKLAVDADGLFGFEYAPEWLAQSDRYPLAPALPLEGTGEREVRRHDLIVRSFFQNLLPEGEALDVAANNYQISKSNLAGLLLALGKETAGAISVQAVGAGWPYHSSVLRPLSKAELHERINARPDFPFSVWDNKVRLSIAGYQDKVAVFQGEGGEWSFVDAGPLASTHILKPEPVRSFLAGMTSNEFACMRLAKALGLPVAEVALAHVPEPLLVVERFDRRNRQDAVERLHCLDTCQVLGLPVGWKYERNFGDSRDVANVREGASLKKIFPLSLLAPVPAAAQLQLLRWAIYQVLIGNTDAHGKNLSFFLKPTVMVPAPAYDLVSTLIYDGGQIADSLAMAIGDNFDPRKLGAYDWALLAQECGLNPRLVARELSKMAGAALKTWPKLLGSLQEEGAELATLERISMVLQQQCAAALQYAPQVPKVAPEML